MGRPKRSRFRPAGRVLLRWAERLLGPGPLGAMLWPGGATLACLRVARGRSEMIGSPGAGRLGILWRVRAETRAVMTGAAWVFRDRFDRARWRGRLRLVDAGPAEAALAAGRAVVIATAHTEAMRLLVRMLCANGVDAAMLVEDASRHSARFGRGAASDGVEGRVIGVSELRRALGFLQGPRLLVVPVDAIRGRCVEATGAGVVGTFATGAARLAGRSGALCVSAVVVQVGLWRYEARFGAAVDAAGSQEAAAALLGRQLLEAVMPHPECWSGVLRGAVRPGGALQARGREGGHACPSAA